MAAGEAGDWNSTLIPHSALLYITVALIGVTAGGSSCRWRAESVLSTAGWVWGPAARLHRRVPGMMSTSSVCTILNGAPFFTGTTTTGFTV